MKPALSIFRLAGIFMMVRRAQGTERVARAVLVAAALAGAAGCGMRPLSADQLTGRHDAGPHDAGGGVDAARDVRMVDAARDVRMVDAARDARDSGIADVGRGDLPPPACIPGGCPTDQFCDDLTGRCAARTGTGMLSGVITDRCTGQGLGAKVGIAGRHLCSFAGKGSYFFTDLPLGTLRLAVAVDGYELAAITVVIAPGGTVVDVPLTRTAPLTCADPPPVVPACTCVEPGCL